MINTGRIYLAWYRNRFSAMAYYICALPTAAAEHEWTRVGPMVPSRGSAASGSGRSGPPLWRIYCNIPRKIWGMRRNDDAIADDRAKLYGSRDDSDRHSSRRFRRRKILSNLISCRRYYEMIRITSKKQITPLRACIRQRFQSLFVVHRTWKCRES
jgi:hypothetical protein